MTLPISRFNQARANSTAGSPSRLALSTRWHASTTRRRPQRCPPGIGTSPRAIVPARACFHGLSASPPGDGAYPRCAYPRCADSATTAESTAAGRDCGGCCARRARQKGAVAAETPLRRQSRCLTDGACAIGTGFLAPAGHDRDAAYIYRAPDHPLACLKPSGNTGRALLTP